MYVQPQRASGGGSSMGCLGACCAVSLAVESLMGEVAQSAHRVWPPAAVSICVRVLAYNAVWIPC